MTRKELIKRKLKENGIDENSPESSIPYYVLDEIRQALSDDRYPVKVEVVKGGFWK